MSREQTITVDQLAQEIRRVDGDHSLGAGALAEALMPFLSAHTVSGGEGWEASLKAADDLVAAATIYEDEALLQDAETVKRALIAVARGGGALPPATPSSVPTEGHGAAVVVPYPDDWKRPRDNAKIAGWEGFFSGRERNNDPFPPARNDLRTGYQLGWDTAAESQAASSDAEQVGTSVASEPNTLPTVQAETAVVGEALLELSRDLHRRADACHDLSKPDQSEAARRRLDGKEAAYRHAAQLAAQAIPPSHQPPVITGEQPGMSEGGRE